ncbi:MAG: hypothetical protein ACJAYF_000222 [Arenicella sp.]|jgi:hypothetical protein
MKLSAKHLFATLGMFTVIVVTPTSAFARGSVHLDIPGLSIGVHDDYRSDRRHRKHQRKHHRKHYNTHRSRHNDHYDKRHYKNRRHNDNYYSSGRYNNQRYDRRDNNYRNDQYYNDRRRVEICPIDGYSRYYQQGRNGYQHKDHYHY